jgi:AraC-like DNA-binding protein
MLINLLYILTSLLGMLIILLVTMQYKSNRVLNAYLLITILLLSIKFLYYGLTDLKIIVFRNNNLNSYLPFFSIGIPSLYLYFKNLVNDTKNFNKKELKHFIFPILLGVCSIFQERNYTLPLFSYLLYLIFTIYHSFYIFISFKFLKKNIWKRKTGLYNVNQQNNLLINWTTFLFLFNCLISLRLIISIGIGEINQSYSLGQNYQWISAILINFIYIKILLSPEILYGYNALYKKIINHRDSNFILQEFWLIQQKKTINNSQDLILKEKISGYITTYLQNIETLVFRNEILRNPLINITDIANKLAIPKSHLIFVFKYHSKVSFSEFKKIIRIYDALNLIEENYLKYNTLESLASKVGFSSYNPFFIAFKEITGTTPQIYHKELAKS